jgi:hypothetical protein
MDGATIPAMFRGTTTAGFIIGMNAFESLSESFPQHLIHIIYTQTLHQHIVYKYDLSLFIEDAENIREGTEDLVDERKAIQF